MATMFLTMLTTMGTGGAAAGTAGAAAAGAAGAGAAAGGLGSILSMGSTIIGGLTSIMSGNAEGAAADQAAVDEETRAVQEQINGKQDALDALRNLNADQAQIAVSGYASGIGGAGSVEAAQNEADRIASRNFETARNNADMKSRSRRIQASQLRKDGSAARSGGIMKAVSAGFKTFNRRQVRG